MYARAGDSITTPVRPSSIPNGAPAEGLPGENRWWPLDCRIVGKVVPERFRGAYLIADADGTPIYAGESPDLRNALRKHAEGASEEAACLRAHGAAQFLFTVVRAKRANREGEWRGIPTQLASENPPNCNPVE